MTLASDAREFESRLDAIRRWEPRIQALVDWNEPAARKRFCDAGSGPLAGWSLGVKDIVDVEGMATRCNADFVPWGPASRDSAVVAALRANGAFVLSKTVTTTFAYFDPGPTGNPWNPDHTPGGSSSGSAAAVACGMVRLGLGSQTVASVNRPASYCGVVGLKPSYGRIPIQGVFAFAPSFDTLGFFTADVSDAAQAYQALTGAPPAPPASRVRVGLLPDLRVEAAETEMLSALEQAGARLESGEFQTGSAALPACCVEAFENHWTLVASEASVVHGGLFREYGDSYPPKLRDLIQRGAKIETSELDRIRRHRERVREEVEDLFNDFHVLLCPSAPGPAPVGIEATGDPRFSLIWTYTGLPTLTLPYCLSRSGLPLGLQLMAPLNREADLLAVGREMESIFRFSRRHAPSHDAASAVRHRDDE